jgi:purine-nucleoside phosphorylase
VLHDHVGIPNLSGFNPLLGPQHDPSILRFLPTSNAYSTSLRRKFFHAVHELGLGLDDFAEGTYAWVSGPTFESPAEGRFLRVAGADVVGMSTVPEVLAAKEEGLEVIALSLVTNFVVIPDTYRSIKAEVKAEVSPISLPFYSGNCVYRFLRSFSSKGRSSRTRPSWLSLTRKSLKSA